MFSFKAVCEFIVSNIHHAAVKVYDYYEPGESYIPSQVYSLRKLAFHSMYVLDLYHNMAEKNLTFSLNSTLRKRPTVESHVPRGSVNS